jgi:hypothetical protein
MLIITRNNSLSSSINTEFKKFKKPPLSFNVYSVSSILKMSKDWGLEPSKTTEIISKIALSEENLFTSAANTTEDIKKFAKL